MLPRVKILMTGPMQGLVYINDVQIDGVMSVKFSAEVGQANVVEIGLIPMEVEIEASDSGLALSLPERLVEVTGPDDRIRKFELR